jgi:hypothetical protein
VLEVAIMLKKNGSGKISSMKATEGDIARIIIG